MKKSTKTLAAAALAISALTPVAAAAASTVEPGVYTATNYYTLAEFKKLSTADKTAALSAPSTVVVVADQAYKATDVLTASNSQLPTLGQKADEYTTPEGNKLVSGKPINPDALKVESVSAITETVFKGKSTQLQFAINGSKEATTVADLTKAGYTVTFETTLDTATTGNVTIASTDTRTSFEYKVVVFKDGKEVAKTELKKVTVQNPTTAKKITKHEVQEVKQDGTKATVSNLVFGTQGVIEIKEYEQLDGTKVPSTTQKLVDLTYKSSNQSVVVVDASGKLIPIGVGTANVTISKAGLEDYVIPVTVVAEKPVATSLTGLANTSLSVAEKAKTLDVVVKDQYDAPVTTGDLVLTSSNTDVATVDTPATIGANGKVKITVKAVKAGTTTVTVKSTEGKVLGAVTVTVQASGDVASYNLETDAKDLTLDRNLTLESLDNELTFKFVSRDAQGLLVADLGLDSKYELTTSDEKALAADKIVNVIKNTDGTFKVVANKTGKVTITAKEGSIVRATKEITVVDTTKPDINVTSFKTGDTFGEFKLDNVDHTKNTATITYTDATKSIGNAPNLGFNVPVKLASIAIDGTKVSDELIYQLVAKASTNFVTAYTSNIDLPEIGTKISELEKLGKSITLTYVNEAGYEGTYTFNLEKK